MNCTYKISERILTVTDKNLAIGNAYLVVDTYFRESSIQILNTITDTYLKFTYVDNKGEDHCSYIYPKGLQRSMEVYRLILPNIEFE